MRHGDTLFDSNNAFIRMEMERRIWVGQHKPPLSIRGLGVRCCARCYQSSSSVYAMFSPECPAVRVGDHSLFLLHNQAAGDAEVRQLADEAMQLHVHPHFVGDDVEEDAAAAAEALGRQALARQQRQRAEARARLRRRAERRHQRAAGEEGDGRVGDAGVLQREDWRRRKVLRRTRDGRHVSSCLS